MAFELNKVVALHQLLILLCGFVVNVNITDRQTIPDLRIGAYSVMVSDLELCIRLCQVKIWGSIHSCNPFGVREQLKVLH